MVKLRRTFWKNVKKKRLNRGWSYSEIAERVGKSETLITTVFSEEENFSMRLVFELLQAMDMTLEQAFGSEVGVGYALPQTPQEAVNNFWHYLDNLYPKLRPISSRRRAIIKLGYWWGKYPRNGLIALTLDKLERISSSLGLTPLQLISSKKDVAGRMYIKKQNGLVNIEVKVEKETVASLMLDGDSTRIKIEDWLMALSSGEEKTPLSLEDSYGKDAQVELLFDKKMDLKISVFVSGLEVGKKKVKKQAVNDLLMKFSRKEKGYKAYLSLLGMEEDG
jgi:transcriptional regulator with XRE-family HTH domain